MKALRLIGIVLGSLIGVYLLAALVMPKSYAVERSRELPARQQNASAALVTDFSEWQRWSPWYQMDTAMQHTYTGAPGQTGHMMAWKSNKMGNGRLTVDSVAMQGAPFSFSQKMTMYSNAWKTASPMSFALEPADNGKVKAVWRSSGDLPFMMRPFGWMFDGFVGKDFEKALVSLDSVSAAEMMHSNISQTTMPNRTVLIEEVPANDASAASIMGQAYMQILAVAQEQKLQQNGPPFRLFMQGRPGTWLMGIPVDRLGQNSGNVKGVTMPGVPVLRMVHMGAYDSLSTSRDRLWASAATQPITPNGALMEEYVTDPTTVTNPADVLTYLYLPYSPK